jgi:hypothetical protein
MTNVTIAGDDFEWVLCCKCGGYYPDVYEIEGGDMVDPEWDGLPDDAPCVHPDLREIEERIEDYYSDEWRY